MRKKIIITSIASVFLIWLFTDSIGHNDSNKPIKKITATTALQLFGRRNIWTFGKHEELYNSRGKLVSNSYYHDNVCDSKYVYSYTKFDSIQKITWFTGRYLTPQRIETWEYDTLNRPCQNLAYEIKTLVPDNLLQEKTTYLYDKFGRQSKTIIQHFSKEYPSTATLTTFANSYNKQGRVFSTRNTFYAPGTLDTSVYITHYTYDSNGRIADEIGGLNSDSIYYKRNNEGQITETRNVSTLFNTINKTWYDENGNRIKVYIDNEGGHTYEYKYNENNKLIKEYRPGFFLFMLKLCITYDYEHY